MQLGSAAGLKLPTRGDAPAGGEAHARGDGLDPCEAPARDDAPARGASLRSRLGAAACMLIAAGTPAAAQSGEGAAPADTTAAAAPWQFDGSALIYGEQQRVNVVEPVGRITRLFRNGQSLSAQIALDAITGASPTGAMPSGQTPASAGTGEDGAVRPIQTTTAASGGSSGPPSPGQIPTKNFNDLRGALDLGWQVPLGSLLVPSVAAHVSREKDYQSLGLSGRVSVDLMHRLTTLTFGGGFNRDGVFPVGGTRVPLDSTGALLTTGSNPKRVTTTLIGLSRILTRRWMVAVDVSRTLESGYLTEPYKVVSVVDPSTGYTTGQFTENRPSNRDRRDVMTSSVYHLPQDVVYLSHRYYWDDWGVRSNTIDLQVRHELGEGTFLQPHVRFYVQTAADFFRFDVLQGSSIPPFITADERLGSLRTATLGATYGFRIPDYPGEFTVRAEYIRWWGAGNPSYAQGVQKTFDLFPAVNIGSLLVGYTRNF